MQGIAYGGLSFRGFLEVECGEGQSKNAKYKTGVTAGP